MQVAKYIPVAILGLLAVLVAVGIIEYAVGDEPDYADLVPAPDSIVWEEGDETTVWLSANRDDVQIRIASVDLGVGSFHRLIPSTGSVQMLGRGEGCLPWAVTDLEVYNIADASGSPAGKQVSVRGAISRGAETGAVSVYRRIYPVGADIKGLTDNSTGVSQVTGDIAANGVILRFEMAASTDSAQEFTSNLYRIPATEGRWVVEASYDSRFPATSRIATTGDVSDLDDWLPAMAEASEVILPQDVGIGLVACAEASDVQLTLHDDLGAELNRYLVDIHADTTAPTPQATPSGVNPIDVRVCVDSADNRGDYLDGWEYVGSALDAVDFGLSAGDLTGSALTDAIDDSGYVYYFVAELVSGDLRIRVSPAGASDTAGLDADRVYPLTVEAVQSSLSAKRTLGIWLDTTTLSPNDNGLCS